MQHYAAFHLGLHCLQKYSFKGFPEYKGFMFQSTFFSLLFLFCLRFYVPVSSYGHVEMVSSPNHTFSWASSAKGLTSTSCTYFPCKWQQPFLNQWKEENEHKIISWSISTKVWDWAGIELASLDLQLDSLPKHFSVISVHFPGLNQILSSEDLAQGPNTVLPVRFKQMTPWSSTEPLRSLCAYERMSAYMAMFFILHHHLLNTKKCMFWN